MKRNIIQIVMITALSIVAAISIISYKTEVRSNTEDKEGADGFALFPGQSVYVGFPEYANGGRNALSATPATLPEAVDHPYIFAYTLSKNVISPVQLRVDASINKDQIKKNLVEVTVVRASAEPRLTSFTSSMRPFDFPKASKIQLAERNNSKRLNWLYAENKSIKWVIFPVAIADFKSLDVIIVVAEDSSLITKKMKLPDTAHYTEVKFGAIE
jgi:hypothetical protein